MVIAFIECGAFTRETVYLPTNSLSDCRNKGDWVQVQVITKNFCELLWGNKGFWKNKNNRGKREIKKSHKHSKTDLLPLMASPFLFHVNVSRSFCPSISISKRIGTRVST